MGSSKNISSPWNISTDLPLSNITTTIKTTLSRITTHKQTPRTRIIVYNSATLSPHTEWYEKMEDIYSNILDYSYAKFYMPILLVITIVSIILGVCSFTRYRRYRNLYNRESTRRRVDQCWSHKSKPTWKPSPSHDTLHLLDR